MELNTLGESFAREEPDRERLLRRADWRFLLPVPQARRSAFSAGERLSQSLRLFSSEVVPLNEAETESCDLVVISNPDDLSLQSACDALCPGGMFYGEWYSPFTGVPAKIQRKLVQAGFEEMAFYWPWPWPDLGSTLFWLPLEAPAALDYFQKTRPPSTAHMHGFARSALRKAWRVARRVRLLVPVCATAIKRLPDATSAVHTGRRLKEQEYGRRQNWNEGYETGTLQWLMLTGGLSNLNKVVKLGFRPGEPAPSLAVKHARVPESIPALVREANNLDSLARLPGGGPKNVPRLLFLDRANETAAVGETVTSGDPLFTHLRKDNYRAWALEATNWLSKLVNPGQAIPLSDWWPRIVEPALAAFHRKYGGFADAGWTKRIVEKLQPLQSLPEAFEHRDFSPWNVLVTDLGQLAVLDWESGEPNGMPGLDLIYFLTFLAFFQEGAMETGDFLPAYRAAQEPGSFTGSIQAECFRNYFGAIGLDPEFATPLRTLAWTIHSLSVLPQIGREAGGKKVEEQGLFVQLIAEDLEMK